MRKVFDIKYLLISTLRCSIAIFLGGCAIDHQILWGMADKTEFVAEDSGTLPELSSLLSGVKHTKEVVGVFASTAYNTKTSQSIVSASVDGDVILWSGTPQISYNLLKIGHPIEKIAYHDGLKRIAVNNGSQIEVYSLSQRKLLYTLTRLKAIALDIIFSPDGRSLVLAGSDSKIYRWKFEQEARASKIIDKEKAFERYNGTAVAVSALAYHPEGKVFFSGDWDGGLNGWFAYDADRYQGEYDTNYFGPRFFSEPATRSKADRKGNLEAIDLLRISEDGSLLYAATQTGRVEVWKVRGLLLGGFAQAHPGVIFAMAISPDGLRIATASRDGRVLIETVREIPQEEMKEKIDRTYDYELTVLKEWQLPDVKSLVWISNDTLIAGDKSGTVMALKVENPS